VLHVIQHTLLWFDSWRSYQQTFSHILIFEESQNTIVIYNKICLHIEYRQKIMDTLLKTVVRYLADNTILIFKMLALLIPINRSGCMAHVQWLKLTLLMWSRWGHHKSRTDSHMTLKNWLGLQHVTFGTCAAFMVNGSQDDKAEASKYHDTGYIAVVDQGMWLN